MLDRLFGFKIHNYLQALGTFILAVGVPLNKVLMSIGTIWLAANLLLKADFSSYWKKWKKSPIFWFVLVVFLLHFLGLFYTTDLSYAARDLNTKLPFFVIPIALIAFPIEKRYLNFLLYGFLLSLLITSVLNFNFMLNNEVENYRGFSLFGSHIRYALLIVNGIAISIYLGLKDKKLRLLLVSLALWFSYYTFISQVFSGYIAFVFLLIACLFYFFKRIKRNGIKVFLSLIIIGVSTAIGVLAYQYLYPKDPMKELRDLPTHSIHGEKYYNDTSTLWFENGHHVLSRIAESELKEAWNKRAEIKYFEKTKEGYELKGILLRYMTSKDLTKDKEGMKMMSNQDIKNVENEITSIQQTYRPVKLRLTGIRNEIFHYSIGGDPDGNSLLQRIEHWKAAVTIIKNNWFFGVGTGDVQEEFNKTYKASNTQLDKEHWNRAHNQFMTFWVSFGILGFLVFTGFWFWFLGTNLKMNNFLGICFALIAIGSFLSEDTIETQQGVTYIALFLGIVHLMNNWNKNEIDYTEKKH